MSQYGHENTLIARAVAPATLLADKLCSILRDARSMPGLNLSFVQKIEDAERLAQGLEPYLASCTTPESVALQDLAADTFHEDWDHRYSRGETSVALEKEMLSGHVEGQFLKMLVHATGAKRVLEIGLFTGYSALAMAEALPADGTLVACELDQFAATFAERAFAKSPHGRKIRIVVANAVETMRQLNDAGEQFDFIFIDADKANYPTYFNSALEGSLLGPNGLICVDNTLMQGQPYMPDEPTPNGRAIAAFNQLVSNDPRVEQVLLPLRDGLTIIRRTSCANR